MPEYQNDYRHLNSTQQISRDNLIESSGNEENLFRPAGFRPAALTLDKSGEHRMKSLGGLWRGLASNLSNVDASNGHRELVRLRKLLDSSDPHDRTLLTACANDLLMRHPTSWDCASEADACADWLCQTTPSEEQQVNGGKSK